MTAYEKPSWTQNCGKKENGNDGGRGVRFANFVFISFFHIRFVTKNPAEKEVLWDIKLKKEMINLLPFPL